jgi:hypothetical protein
LNLPRARFSCTVWRTLKKEGVQVVINVTIDLSEQNAAALEAQARAAHMPPESYLSKIVARALHCQPAGEMPE